MATAHQLPESNPAIKIKATRRLAEQISPPCARLDSYKLSTSFESLLSGRLFVRLYSVSTDSERLCYLEC